MVARVNTGKSINKALNYNEKKVQNKEAECLHAQNFLKDANDMNFYEKLKSFEKLSSLNERTETNTLHVSLNFDPSEKLDNEKMIDIANSYMEQIGFKDQPYLIYRHYDTGHPHIHIISTNIQSDGNRISMHNLGRNQSEAARKKIEVDFDLVKAESKKNSDALKLKPVAAQKISADKRETKAAIANVLGIIIPQYRYASLEELNAVLRLYNVEADRCSENSETYKHNGLFYRVLDEHGNKISTPIKASAFYMKPTLKNLEIRFAENKKLKQPHAKHLKDGIDFAFLKNPKANLKHLIEALNKEGISTVLRQNKDDVIYGITFVDHKTKCVFNGSDLGKQYSAKMILERTNHQSEKIALPIVDEKEKLQPQETQLLHLSDMHLQKAQRGLLDILIDPTASNENTPYALKKKRKRKKKHLKI